MRQVLAAVCWAGVMLGVGLPAVWGLYGGGRPAVSDAEVDAAAEPAEAPPADGPRPVEESEEVGPPSPPTDPAGALTWAKVMAAKTAFAREQAKANYVENPDGSITIHYSSSTPFRSVALGALRSGGADMEVADQATELGKLLHGTWASFSSTPWELQFSCCRCTVGDGESEWGRLLKDAAGDVVAIAARVLWSHRSRTHAAAVLERVDAARAQGAAASPAWRETIAVVDAELTPARIILLLQDREAEEWGVWCARMRPHRDLVPWLLARARPDRADVALALAASGDRRAYQLFLADLQSGEYRRGGFAAKALGELGLFEAEGPLLAAMDGAGVWAEAQMALALGKVGRGRALAALKRRRLMIEGEYTGAIDLDGCLDRAIAQLESRLGR